MTTKRLLIFSCWTCCVASLVGCGNSSTMPLSGSLSQLVSVTGSVADPDTYEKKELDVSKEDAAAIYEIIANNSTPTESQAKCAYAGYFEVTYKNEQNDKVSLSSADQITINGEYVLVDFQRLMDVLQRNARDPG